MAKRSSMSKTWVAVLIGSLLSLVLSAAPVTEPAAGVTGAILSASDQSPLPGALLHVGDPLTGRVYTSSPSTADGSFVLEQVPPSTYEVAIQSDGGLYMVAAPLQLAPGQVQILNITVNARQDPQPLANSAAAKGFSSFWNNPLTAAGIVLGSAIVLGYAVKEWTEEDSQPTQIASP